MYIERLQARIEPLKSQLIHHPLYQEMSSISDVKIFMQHHQFAVWDFMSLVKYLQRELTCVSLPWMPVGSAQTRFLINEIVLGEESDVDAFGNRISHFELYAQAMKELGVSTQWMEAVLQFVQNGASVSEALEKAVVPASIQDFVNLTFRFIEEGKVHVVAAVFTFGREDLIPDMFSSMVNELNTDGSLNTFRYYLERHIEVDGDHHSHLALQMLSELCGEDGQKWQEAEVAVEQCLQARITLWDGVLSSLNRESLGMTSVFN
jgi:hypothetical protein